MNAFHIFLAVLTKERKGEERRGGEERGGRGEKGRGEEREKEKERKKEKTIVNKSELLNGRFSGKAISKGFKNI